MEKPGCPRRRLTARLIGWMLMASLSASRAEPVAVNPRWHVTFPAAPNGAPGESTAVAVNGDSSLVAILSPGADGRKPELHSGNQKIPAQVIGIDPVSRLAFIKVIGPSKPKTTVWLDSAAQSFNKPLRAPTSNGTVKCRATRWVKQVPGKILPLALLDVTFDEKVPPPGTPLLDESGRVAAILFQASGTGKTGYAIPAEAVHRVRRDIDNGGDPIRGWLGLALHSENKAPKIVRVIPNSPAAKAGVRAGDMLVSVGSRNITGYADVADAFFYLIPGETSSPQAATGIESPLSLAHTHPPAGGKIEPHSGGCISRRLNSLPENRKNSIIRHFIKILLGIPPRIAQFPRPPAFRANAIELHHVRITSTQPQGHQRPPLL